MDIDQSEPTDEECFDTFPEYDSPREENQNQQNFRKKNTGLRMLN